MNRFRFVAGVLIFVAGLCGCASNKSVVAAIPSAKQPVAAQPAPAPQPQPRLPFDSGPASASDPYPTMVDYAWTPAQLCTLSGCKKIDADVLAAITASENCTIVRCGSGTAQVGFRLVKTASTVFRAHLHDQNGEDLGIVAIVGHGSPEDAAKFMDQAGLRPATARELITFVMQHKAHFESEAEVVALGTPFRNDRGNLCYASAERDADGDVHISATFVGPGSRTTFLAAPK